MSEIKLILIITRCICFIIGFYLNLLLIYFILKSKIKELIVFKNVMIQTCLINLYFLLIVLVIQPVN